MKIIMLTKFNLTTAFLFASIMMASCMMPQLYYQQLSNLDKGMPPEQTISRLKLSPLSVHAMTVGNRTFEFHKYLLNNGVGSDVYYLAFEQQRLIYWGYINEFRRQPDRDLNQALSGILTAVN